MQRWLFRSLLISFSLLLTACPGPKVSVCISSGDVTIGMNCVDKNQKPFDKKYEDSKNMVCFIPEDFQTIAEYCKLGSSPK